MKFRPKRFLWITDPWDTLDHERDTTLRLAHEAVLLGHESYWCSSQDIQWNANENRVLVCAVKFSREFKLEKAHWVSPENFDSIHYRVDPPVDLAYAQPLQILMLASPKLPIVNPPTLLLSASEKLEGLLLPTLSPPSVVSCDLDELLEFLESEKKSVLKPLHLAQSKGIELLDFRQITKAKKLIKTATLNGTRPILLQRYLEKISQGEQRLWFMDGKLLGAVRKLPQKGDFRVNIDGGSQVVTTRLNKTEQRASLLIGKHLKARKIRMAAVDLIDGLITDFNFTSPGLLVQMEKLLKRNLAREIIRGL